MKYVDMILVIGWLFVAVSTVILQSGGPYWIYAGMAALLALRSAIDLAGRGRPIFRTRKPQR